MFHSQLEKSWMDSRISQDLITLLAHQVTKIAPTYSLTTRTSKSTAHGTDPTVIPPLQDFIDLLARRSRTRTGTALVAMTLLGRLSQRLGLVTTTGLASAPQRIFLASLIISTKLIHDTSPKNKHWLAFANGYFELDEINLMEKQFLTLMDFNLSISDYDFAQVVDHYKRLHKDNSNNRKKIKSNRWQDTPDHLVSPNRSVALVAKTTRITTHSSSSSTSSLRSALSASSSSSSTSSLMTLSLSSTPVLDPLLSSNSTSSTLLRSPNSPVKTMKRAKRTWCYPTKSPLISV
ncbi:hypothetical protein BC941DRAFT_466877 [Chlamydoabsidia padenii]|nr:hypothetical protein BC941DRAFT_466877 [Chlamydoabsidia padenii]